MIWFALILSKINVSDDIAAAAKDVDLLSESITEDPKIKGLVFSAFNKVCPAHTIFMTNTSTLLPSQYAAETGRASKFAAFHFHNPVWIANVVDIMPHAGTDPDILKNLHDFAISIGQIPVLIQKESNGYIFNAILDGILRSSLELAANDVASVYDIDRAWMGITKMDAGPFGVMDIIGIDLIYNILKKSTKWVFFLPQVRRAVNFLNPYIEKGWFGRKSNRGFYAYPDPAFEAADFIEKGVQE